jgi:hypothetical protein
MNPEKDRHKQLKQAYKEAQAKQSLPPPINPDEYEALIRFLEKNLEGEEDGLKLTTQFLEQNNLPVRETIQWLESLHCYDDEEVLDWGLFVIDQLTFTPIKTD